jgi:hypothetical protein
MSNPILALYALDSHPKNGDAPFATLATRAESLSALPTGRNFDLLILGGGVTAAVVAHQAALREIKVLVLHPSFFGDRALSWKPRISHLQRTRPMEVLRGRATLQGLEKIVAPHLVANAPEDTQRVESFGGRIARRWVPDRDLDERLLIRETILAARQEGATALAAAQPTYVEAESDTGCYLVGFRDLLANRSYEVRVGGIVLDPSGAVLPPSRLGTPVMKLPQSGPGGEQRVYQVVPRTTKSGDRFASFELSDGSFVSVQRIGEQRLEVTVLYGSSALASAVVDTICGQAASEAGWQLQAEISSRDVDGHWAARYKVSESRGIFTCAHRGPWDAFRSAHRIVKTLVSYSKDGRPFKRLPVRSLPGAEQACELNAFRAQARGQGVSEESIELCITRWQGRVRYLSQFPGGLTPLCPGVLRGEVDLAYLSDQTTTIEDLMFGSLALHRLPGWQNLIAPISARMREFEAQ